MAKKQKSNTSSPVARVRVLFNSDPKCVAVRDGNVIYTKGAQGDDGSFEIKGEGLKTVNAAKKVSVEMQLDADGAPRDKEGNFGVRYHHLGKGHVRVMR